MAAIPTGQVLRPAELAVTATAAAASGVTLTIPAVAGAFHYIVSITIQCYATAARAGGATPTIVTSTNLGAALTWNFDTAQAIGTQIEKTLFYVASPVRSAASNTNTTIVCPATTSVIWNVNVVYYADSI